MKQGWEIKKLGEVFTLKAGKSISSDNIKPDGGEKMYPCFGGNGIRGCVDTYIAEGAYPIIGRVGALCGNIQLSQGKFYATEHAIVAYIKSNDIKAEWAVLALKSLNLRQYAKGVAQPVISAGQLAELSIPIPPRAEQERIVAELDCLSGVIEKKREQLRELDALAQSIFYQMFGDPITNEKGWEVKPLKNSVIEMFLGPFGSALKTDCYVSKEDAYCMVYEQKHAIKKTMELETHYIDKDKFESLKRFEVHSGDFIMSCRGTIGEIYRLPNNAPIGIIHPSLMKIRIKEDVYHPTFFIRLLTHIVKNENTNGNCVQMAITAKELGARTPITPPLTLQQEFADKIEAIEKQKELIKQSISKTEELFNSRMDYYFN